MCIDGAGPGRIPAWPRISESVMLSEVEVRRSHETVAMPETQNWAHNSAVECHLHTVEVVGSNPAVPTI